SIQSRQRGASQQQNLRPFVSVNPSMHRILAERHFVWRPTSQYQPMTTLICFLMSQPTPSLKLERLSHFKRLPAPPGAHYHQTHRRRFCVVAKSSRAIPMLYNFLSILCLLKYLFDNKTPHLIAPWSGFSSSTRASAAYAILSLC